jgi:hypothetical protein
LFFTFLVFLPQMMFGTQRSEHMNKSIAGDVRRGAWHRAAPPCAHASGAISINNRTGPVVDVGDTITDESVLTVFLFARDPGISTRRDFFVAPRSSKKGPQRTPPRCLSMRPILIAGRIVGTVGVAVDASRPRVPCAVESTSRYSGHRVDIAVHAPTEAVAAAFAPVSAQVFK